MQRLILSAHRAIIFAKAPVTELAGKLKAQQSANRVDIDLVLTGSDGLAAGLVNQTWMKILPDFSSTFPNLEENYVPAALNLLKAQGDGYGVVINYYPSGPLLVYDPERVKKFPTTAEELLAYAKEESRPLHVCPSDKFRPGPHIHDGIALSPRR